MTERAYVVVALSFSVFPILMRGALTSCGAFTLVRSPTTSMRRSTDFDHTELLDHVIVLNEQHFHRLLREFLDYYQKRPHALSLLKDPPTAVSENVGAI